MGFCSVGITEHNWDERTCGFRQPAQPQCNLTGHTAFEKNVEGCSGCRGTVEPHNQPAVDCARQTREQHSLRAVCEERHLRRRNAFFTAAFLLAAPAAPRMFPIPYNYLFFLFPVTPGRCCKCDEPPGNVHN
eukprot:gene7997-biopygen1552